jgi:hypothetical protein
MMMVARWVSVIVITVAIVMRRMGAVADSGAGGMRLRRVMGRSRRPMVVVLLQGSPRRRVVVHCLVVAYGGRDSHD